MLHPIRRRILAHLVDERATTRSRLASLLVHDEAIFATDIEHIEVVLHHNHLPKLDDDDYIDYDRRTGDVVLWEDPATIRECLDVEHRSSSSEHEN